MEYTIHKSDLDKVHDALLAAEKFLMARDEMNAAVHLAATVRLSPVTSTVIAARERIETFAVESDERTPNG